MEQVAGILADPDEVKKLLSKGHITDINAFIKAQARANPDLVRDPAAFEANWDEDKASRALTAYKSAEAEGIGSRRAQLQDIVEEFTPSLAEAFKEATPKVQFTDRLIERMSFAMSNDEVDKLFTWAEVESGEKLGIQTRGMILLHAVGFKGTELKYYRGLRKIFLAIVASNTVEIEPSQLMAKNKDEAIQIAIQVKLLKASTIEEIEDIFAWGEIERGMGFSERDKYMAFWITAQRCPISEEQYKAIKAVFVRMR